MTLTIENRKKKYQKQIKIIYYETKKKANIKQNIN